MKCSIPKCRRKATLQLLGAHPICRKCGDEKNRKARKRSAIRRAKGLYSPSILARRNKVKDDGKYLVGAKPKHDFQFFGCQFKITTDVLKEYGEIIQSVTVPPLADMRAVIRTQDEHIRAALIKIGWTPPVTQNVVTMTVNKFARMKIAKDNLK